MSTGNLELPAARLESVVTQAVGLVGFASLETGVYLIHIPSAFIVGGALALVWSILRSAR